MTKKEAISELIEWLDHSNYIRRNLAAGNYFSSTDEWFRRCEEMYAAYKAVTDLSTGNEMPIDPPSPPIVVDGFWPHGLPEPLGFAYNGDNVADGINSLGSESFDLKSDDNQRPCSFESNQTE